MNRVYAATVPVGLLAAVFVCRDLDVSRAAFAVAWATFTIGLAGLARFAQVELVNATPSTKVVHDAKGHPWLVVSRPPNGGYVAQRLEVTAEFEFDRSWQAVTFVQNWPVSGLEPMWPGVVEVGE